jgi:hypothetical protein
MQNQVLLEKLNELPPHKISEVEDFIDFLRHKTKHKSEDSRYRAISEYAEEHAGSDADFDETLEQASVEFLIADDEK